MRELERCERKEVLCNQVSQLHWRCRPELDSMLARERSEHVSATLRNPCDFNLADIPEPVSQSELLQMQKATPEYPASEWPTQSCRFWSGIGAETDMQAITETQEHLKHLHMQVTALEMANRLDGIVPHLLLT